MFSIIEFIRSEPNAGVVLSTLLFVAFVKYGLQTIKKGFNDTAKPETK